MESTLGLGHDEPVVRNTMSTTDYSDRKLEFEPRRRARSRVSLILLAELCLTMLVAGHWTPALGATVSWIGGDGDWNTATSWSPNQVPGPADTVLITASGTYTVTLNANAQVATLVLGGASGNQSLTISSNTISSAEVSTLGANGILNLIGSSLAGPWTMSGTLNWTGGVLSGGAALTVASNAVMNIGGNGTLDLYGALTNAGTVNWSGTGDLQLFNGAQGYTGGIDNLAGAVFNARNDQAVNCACYGGEYFNNAGLFRKSVGTKTTTINVAFNNTGTADVQSGTISLQGNYSLTGGTLNFGINSVTSFGQLILGGAAASAAPSAPISTTVTSRSAAVPLGC